MDIGLLGGLAEGLKTGLGTYMDLQERNRKIAEDAEDRKYKRAMMNVSAAKEGLIFNPESGEIVADPSSDIYKMKQQKDQFGLLKTAATSGLLPKYGESGQVVGFEQTPEKKEERELNKEYKKALINAAKEKASASGYSTEQTQGLIPGYQKTIKGKVDSKDLRDMRDAASDQKSLDSILGQIVEKGRNVTIYDQLNPASKTKNEIENLLRDAQLIYKSDAFAKLGVLTGPDLRILEQVIENPASLTASIKGKENIISRIDGVRERVKQKLDNKLESRGFLPIKKNKIPQLKTEDQDALDWANNNPGDKRSIEIKSKLKEAYNVEF